MTWRWWVWLPIRLPIALLFLAVILARVPFNIVMWALDGLGEHLWGRRCWDSWDRLSVGMLVRGPYL